MLPRTFFFPDAINEQPAVLIPGALDPARTQANVVISPLVRLRDGVSVAAATERRLPEPVGDQRNTCLMVQRVLVVSEGSSDRRRDTERTEIATRDGV